MSSPRAVVTGAAGFIGSHMVDLLLERDYIVHAIDNLSSGRLENLAHHKTHPALTVDTRDLRAIGEADRSFEGASYVFHFAGMGDIVPSIERPTAYMDANAMGTVHALEAARFAGVKKFVYAASSSCYGLATEFPTTERARIDPRYPYALSKLLAEEALCTTGATLGRPIPQVNLAGKEPV